MPDLISQKQMELCNKIKCSYTIRSFSQLYLQPARKSEN